MSVTKIADIFNIGVDILKTSMDAATKTILAQIGNVVGQKVYGDGAEWWQTIGFSSRPANPTGSTRAAQGVVIQQGDRDIVIASRDGRSQQIYGSLAEGETCVYAVGPKGTGQSRILLKQDGSINIYTTSGNSSSGQSIILSVTPTAINMGTPWGAFVMDTNGVKIGTTGGAGIQLGADGTVTIIGTKVALNGGSIAIGATASPATPALVGPSGMAGVPSTSVFISP